MIQLRSTIDNKRKGDTKTGYFSYIGPVYSQFSVNTHTEQEGK